MAISSFPRLFKDNDKKVLESPFSRIVDLWFLCVCLGAYQGKSKDTKDHYRFMDGSVLKDDHDKIANLEIIAISVSGDETIIERSSDMLRILNGFAYHGIEVVFSGLTSGHLEGLWNLTDHLENKVLKS
ncbi:MAG: hypothetical protein CMG55_05040 [Candidatus Marinimicrobia bacterium]|nr:hypothetical protein [Candidatus Neomarinimicrobiota bacterium]